MRKPFLLPIFALACLLGIAAPFAGVLAQEPTAEEQPVREIYVPFEDLNVVLEGQPRRVFLTREQYRELKAKADEAPAPPGGPATILSAEYDAAIDGDLARIVGTIVIDAPDATLQALPLDLAGVGLLSAELDGRPAAIGRRDDGRLLLFVAGGGRRELKLKMTAPLQIAAAEQVLSFQLHAPAVARLRLSVPGNVELKGGAAVIHREVDAAAGVTRFELIPAAGPTGLVMSLNNRLRRQENVVLARSVLVDEMTVAYERLHATVSLAVLQGAIDRVRFALPPGFEVTDVLSPRVAQWAVDSSGEVPILEARLHAASAEAVVLNISAVRTGAPPDVWSMPRLTPQDVAGHVAVVGLLVEERLRASGLTSEALIPIDTAVLTGALPPSVLLASPGAPRVRPVAAYYAPQEAFALSARFDQPPRKLLANTFLLLTLSEAEQELRGGFALTPEAEKLFALRFTAPRDWDVTEITAADGSKLAFERHVEDDGPARIDVRLPAGIPPGAPSSIFFRAVRTPPEWLTRWTRAEIEFPVFAVADADRDRGAVAVAARDDLAVRPGPLVGLTPLDDAERADYGLAGMDLRLAYRYDGQPYEAKFLAERVEPWIAARTHSFLKVELDGLAAHYELSFDIQQAAARSVAFSLPETTPAEIALRGIDGAMVKEYTGRVADGRRRWTVELAEAHRGELRLAIDLRQPLEGGEQKGLALPLVRAEGVAYQSGLVAVEGHAELDVAVAEHPRKIDVGELAAANYVPGRRLLGAFEFVGDDAGVLVDISRRPSVALPPVIVERAELATMVSPRGLCQTAARYSLRTKEPYLEVRLPAAAQLWTVLLDGEPTKPQIAGDRLLIGLPTSGGATLRDLRIVYEQPTDTIAWLGSVELPAPRLFLRGDGQESSEVPVADLQWHLHLPEGYRLIGADGTVFATGEGIEPREPAVAVVGRTLYALAGGVDPFYQDSLGSGIEFTGGRNWRVASETAGYAPPTSLSAPAPASSMPESAYSLSYEQRGVEFLDGANAPTAAATPAAADYALDREQMPPPFVDDADGDALMGMRDEAGDAAAPEGPVAEMAEVPAAGGEAAPPGDDQMPGFAGPGGPGGMVGPGVSGPATAAPPRRAALWALEGLRSLPIELEPSGRPITFQSLGSEPRLRASLVDGRRLDALAWSAGLITAFVGVLLTGRTGRVKFRFVTAVLVASMALSVLTPLLTGWEHELLMVFDGAFLAGCALIPYYLLAELARGIVSAGRRSVHLLKPVAAAVAVTVACGVSTAAAQEVVGIPVDVAAADAALPPIVLPPEALIVPFDPEDPAGPAHAERLLLSYDKYVELWNRAYPDQKIVEHPLPAAFGLAGAAFTAELIDGDRLAVVGHVDVDVYADGPVSVPLALEGGVLARAEVAGQPARLRSAELDPAAVAPANVPPGAFVVLYLEGPGRHRLDVAVRYRLQRDGGWRIAAGRLPSAPATTLTLRVPQARTEVRLAGLYDALQHETAAAGETIETALGGEGLLNLRWRPLVAEAQVDRSLSVESTAVFDVGEDGLRLAWQAVLNFPRAQRESFRFAVPNGYLVEQVLGGNVRGWETRPGEAQQQIEVTLLQPARDQETVTLLLSRRGAILPAAAAVDGEVDEPAATVEEFEAPAVAVEGALLHQGLLAVRRSPLLDLRPTQVAGLTRADFPSDMAVAAAGGDASQSPLGARPFQAYRFATMPFTLRLAAAPVAGRPPAVVRSVLKIAARETTLESQIAFGAAGRPLYVARVALPDGLRVDEVAAPAPFEWAETDEDGRRVVSVYLSTGQQAEFSVLLRGTLPRPADDAPQPLPRLEVLDAARQQGDIVVQVDPAVDVRAEGLAGCESVLLARVHPWLQERQRELARLAIHYESPDYSGSLRTSARQPRVQVFTLTNVRVTDRAIQETILLDFTIRDAGIREVSFVLPKELAEARITCPLLRQKTVESLDGDRVRVRLELQDAVMDQLRVLVERDRGLATRVQFVPLPVVETGRTDQRYVTLENSGRGELVVEAREGLDALSREQRQWQTLAALLGENIIRAFVVRDDAGQPTLSYRAQDRAEVETAGARIGLAQSTLVVDGNGAYRGAFDCRVDNRTEQYLEVQLPEGAELWTATVAGEPVKPVEPPGAAPGRVTVPLVKTAEGDKDYAVVLKYGGSLPDLGDVESVSFPLVRTVNITVELSQVRLRLPESHSWFNFGGSMRLASDEGDLTAGYVSYRTRQLERLSQVLGGSSEFAKARAKSNLKSLSTEAAELQRQAATQYIGNEQLQQEIASNTRALQQANEQVAAESATLVEAVVEDNREKLSELTRGQMNRRAQNVVEDAGENFDASGASVQNSVTQNGSPPADGERFSQKWLAGNALQGQEAALGVDQSKVDEGKLRYGGGGFGGGQSGEQQDQSGLGERLAREPMQQPPSPEMQIRDGRESASEGDEVAKRYRDRLENEADEGRGQVAQADAERQQAGIRLEDGLSALVDSSESMAVGATPGLTSLDVDLPVRGVEYLFTTPLGEVEITATGVSNTLRERLIRLAILLAVLAGAALAVGGVRRALQGRLSRRLFAVGTIALGVLALLSGIFPLAGLAAAIVGVVLVVRQFVAGPPQPAR